MDGIDTKRQHALKQVEKAETQSVSQEVDLAKEQKKLDDLKKDLERAEREVERHRTEQKRAAQEKGISLSSEDLAEYNKLYVGCALPAPQSELTSPHELNSFLTRLRAPASCSKTQASTKAISDREALGRLVNDEKTKSDTQASVQDQLESTQRKIEILEAEEATLIRRRDTVRSFYPSCSASAG